MDIYKGVLAVAVGATAVIGEEARDECVRAVEYIQFFHVKRDFAAKLIQMNMKHFVVRLKFWRPSIFLKVQIGLDRLDIFLKSGSAGGSELTYSSWTFPRHPFLDRDISG